MFERNLLKTIKDTALQSHHILQVCAPHPVLPTLPDNLGDSSFSLRCKHFGLVSEQRKTKERDSWLWLREKWNEHQKMKEGEGKEGFLPLFPNPSSLFCFRHFDSRSPFFAPKPHWNACYAGYSSFWTVSLVLQIRVWNLLDNHQSLLFLVDSKILCMCRMSYFTVNMEHFLIKSSLYTAVLFFFSVISSMQGHENECRGRERKIKNFCRHLWRKKG